MTSIMGHAGLMLNGWDVDAQALFDRFASDPSGTVKNKINTLIVSLKDEGVWDLLDSLYVPAKTGEQQGGLCDWKRSTKSATLNGTCTWDNTNGFVGDAAVGSFVNLDFIPSTMGVNYKLHAASAGAYFTADSSGACNYFGGSSGATTVTRFQRTTGSLHYSTVNSSVGGSAFYSSALTVANKLISCQRSGSGTNTSCYLYVDGIETGTTDTADAGALSTVTMYACSLNSSGISASESSGSMAAWYAGAALSSGQMIAFNAALEVYLS